MAAKKGEDMKKLYTLSLIALLVGGAVQAMEKPAEKESLDAFIKRMQGERKQLVNKINQITKDDLIDALLDFDPYPQVKTQGVPNFFIGLYDIRNNRRGLILFQRDLDQGQLKINNIKMVNLDGYSAISAVAISNVDYEIKQKWIKQLIDQGVVPNQKDKDMAALIEYEQDPDKVERRYELLRQAQMATGRPLPKEMMQEILKDIEKEPLIPKGTPTAK